jgi:cytoskeletal protein CcmA (bactofilin family)
MGRSSKGEAVAEPQQEAFNQTSGNLYGYETSLHADGRVVSESESMARDIKEGRLSGFVGNGTVLTGETNFQAMLRVDGHLTGSVGSEAGTLVIGSTGRVDANIAVACAVVNGTVNGDITASERIELGRTARVIGNISTPQLIIEQGAIFEGGCTMLKAKESMEKRAPQNYGYTSAIPSPAETNELNPTNLNNKETLDADDEESLYSEASSN